MQISNRPMYISGLSALAYGETNRKAFSRSAKLFTEKFVYLGLNPI